MRNTLFLLLAFSGCDQAPAPTAPTGGEEDWQWHPPSRLVNIGRYSGTFASGPLDVDVTPDGRAHLVVRQGADTLATHERFDLIYGTVENGSWTEEARFSDYGWVPFASVSANSQGAHVFWSGIPHEKLGEEWPIWSSPAVFHCFVATRGCSPLPTKLIDLSERDRRRRIRGLHSGLGPQGAAHIVLQGSFDVPLITVSPDGTTLG